MKKALNKLAVMAVAATALFTTSCKKDNDGYTATPAPTVNAVVISTSGDSAAIVAKLNEFRLLAGDPLNTVPGAVNGRREVNWDGVPPALTNNGNFPFDFFGTSDATLPDGRKRGLMLATPGTGFRVDTTDFSDIDASYTGQFQVFSKRRLFATLGSNVTEVTFKVPGTNTAAFVKSFGVIFSDVDNISSTDVEYFAGTKSLGIYKAKPAAQGFSFLGVGFPDEKVTRIKITSGNGILGAGVKDISDYGTKDLVVMDDFLYDEPRQIN